MSDRPHIRQLLREQILLSLHAARPGSLPAATLQAGLSRAGYPCDVAEVERELGYLRDKGLASEVRPALSAGYLRHAVTAAGVDYLEGENLV